MLIRGCQSLAETQITEIRGLSDRVGPKKKDFHLVKGTFCPSKRILPHDTPKSTIYLAFCTLFDTKPKSPMESLVEVSKLSFWRGLELDWRGGRIGGDRVYL